MAYKMGKKSPCRMEDIIAGEQMLDFSFGGGDGVNKSRKNKAKTFGCPGGKCRIPRDIRKQLKKHDK